MKKNTRKKNKVFIDKTFSEYKYHKKWILYKEGEDANNNSTDMMSLLLCAEFWIT